MTTPLIKFVKPKDRADPIVATFVHCSASDYPDHDHVEVIKAWHLARGFNDVGYHFFIRRNGDLQLGRPTTKIPAAQLGHNTGTLAICLHGLNEFSEEQFITLRTLCNQINDEYDGNMRFRGHKEVDPGRLCPVYDYKKVLNLDENGHIRKTV